MDPDKTPPEQADAQAPHDADRPPTPEEERWAESWASNVAAEVSEEYERSIERGADVKGEGEIVPDQPPS